MKIPHKFWNSLAQPTFSYTDKSPTLYFHEKLALHWFQSAGFNLYPLQTLNNRLGRYVDNWDSIRNGSIDLHFNTVAYNPKTGEQTECVLDQSHACPVSITASGALLHPSMERWNVNGTQFIDGAYQKNVPVAPLLNINATDIIMISPLGSEKTTLQAKPGGPSLILSQMDEDRQMLSEERPDLCITTITPDQALPVSSESFFNTRAPWLRHLKELGAQNAGTALADWHEKTPTATAAPALAAVVA